MSINMECVDEHIHITRIRMSITRKLPNYEKILEVICKIMLKEIHLGKIVHKKSYNIREIGINIHAIITCLW